MLSRWVSLRCWLAVTAKQRAHLRLAEPPVSTGGSDAGYPSGSRPAGDGLRIYPEQGSHLSRREQALVVAVHVQSPPTVSPEPPVRYPYILALNEYFLPRFREIRHLCMAKNVSLGNKRSQSVVNMAAVTPLRDARDD